MSSPALQAHDISVSYNNVQALKGVDILVPEGIVMGIVGPNGSGKSTLMKAALGLIERQRGTVEFFGQPLGRVRNRIGYMPQHTSVDWDFPITVEQVVLMGTYGQLGWFRRPGTKERQRAEQAMVDVSITDLRTRQIGELSGGQRQRVFLARTLAGQPDLLFMDEPFQGIDHISQQAIVDVFHSLRAQGKTIVVVHHDLNTVPDLCDHVTLLSGGSVVTAGPVSEAFNRDTIQAAYGQAPVKL
ncbi:metal ABC transporter ATP-binding protein [Corynebacterium sp.]|uniref:metal ABC transporter ATP-binding protein n=1 Tax=Corynebacterium sp. TaxID=1720 RepID=UPI003736A821